MARFPRRRQLRRWAAGSPNDATRRAGGRSPVRKEGGERRRAHRTVLFACPPGRTTFGIRRCGLSPDSVECPAWEGWTTSPLFPVWVNNQEVPECVVFSRSSPSLSSASPSRPARRAAIRASRSARRSRRAAVRSRPAAARSRPAAARSSSVLRGPVRFGVQSADGPVPFLFRPRQSAAVPAGVRS